MLIRWATTQDKPEWLCLADEVGTVFQSPEMAQDPNFLHYIDSKIEKYEALVAVDRMSVKALGFLGFSRTHNRISWLAVFENHRGKGIGTRLLSTALRQLDTTRDITVVTFAPDDPSGLPARAVYHKAGFRDTDEAVTDGNGNPRCRMVLPPSGEMRGGSFHYRYPEYDHYSKLEFCRCCNGEPMPDGQADIAELGHSFACAERIAQGRLFGKCYVLIKNHHIDFEEIPLEEMAGFMADVQRVGKALHRITGAIKINYEIHSNSGPHIHCHLFPRYLDDDFPSAPIDYCVTEPSPYESEEEFLWFIEQMRKASLINPQDGKFNG